MAEITLISRVFGSEQEIKSRKAEIIQPLFDDVMSDLELVKTAFEKKFPRLLVEWIKGPIDPYDIDISDTRPFDLDDRTSYLEEKEEELWEIEYSFRVTVSAPVENPELGGERVIVDEFTHWKESGSILNVDILEHLSLADWSSFDRYRFRENESVEVWFGVVRYEEYENDDNYFYLSNLYPLRSLVLGEDPPVRTLNGQFVDKDAAEYDSPKGRSSVKEAMEVQYAALVEAIKTSPSWNQNYQIHPGFLENFRLEDFGFDVALMLLKEGFRLYRSGWKEKGMWIELVSPDGRSPGAHFQQSPTHPLYLYIRTSSCAPWLTSQADVLAEDWAVAYVDEAKSAV